MQLNIDYREKALLQRIPVEPKNLTLGDITIEKDGKELLIIERKTISDLASSICDGRYKEQSFRLTESPVLNHNILYLIEGSLNDSCSLSKKALISSLISLWYHKGFTIFRTESVDDTAEFIKIITPENIDVIMLSQIPSISSTTATALMATYKTIFQLEKALQENKNCLDTFMCGKRKISKTSVENIKSFFHL